MKDTYEELTNEAEAKISNVTAKLLLEVNKARADIEKIGMESMLARTLGKLFFDFSECLVACVDLTTERLDEDEL